MTSQPVQHVWYYQKSTLVGVRDEGPFTEAQLLQLANGNQLTLSTPIRSPTRTQNRWIRADAIQSLALAINQAKIDADAKKREDAEHKRRQKQDLAMAQQLAKLEAAKSKSSRREQPTPPEKNPGRMRLEDRSTVRHGDLLKKASGVSNGGVQQPAIHYSTIQPAPSQIISTTVVMPSQHANSLGIASLVLGILAFGLTCIPFVGFAVGSVAFLLGLCGFIAALSRNGSGIGYAAAGMFLALFPIGITALVLFSAVAGSVADYGSSRRDYSGAAQSPTWNPGNAGPLEGQTQKSATKTDPTVILNKFEIKAASIHFEKQSSPERPTVRLKFEVNNGTGQIVTKGEFSCEYISPGQEYPWNASVITYDIPGGLAPGKSATWELTPAPTTSWANLKEKPGATLRVRVEKLYGRGGVDLTL